MMAQLKDLLVMGPGRIIGDAFFGGKLMPTVTQTQDIGSETIKWNNIYGNLKGNADTATKFAAKVSINGTDFDGSSNITTDKWGQKRTVTISDNDGTYTQANTDIDGSGNFTLKLPATIKATLKGNADTASDASKLGGTAKGDLLSAFGLSTNTLSVTVGGTTKSTSAVGSVAVSWSDGTTNGPSISVAVNSVSTSAAIPIATTTVSGVVNTIAQSFAGHKTFNDAITVTGEATFNGNVHLNSSTNADSLIAGSLVVSGNTSLVNDTNAGNIYPSATNSKNLGSSSLRWAKLYIGDADSYGSATQAVYWNAGVPKAVDVSVTKAGAANYLAYYDAVGSIKGTSNIQVIDGCLNLYPSNGSWREGMRIHPYGGWSDITLMGNTNTNTSNIAATDWFIGNNNGTFYLTHNGSSSSTTGYLKAYGTTANKGRFEIYNYLAVNGSNDTYNLYVNGTSYFNNTLTATNFTHQTLTASGYTAAVATTGETFFPATWKLNLGRAPVDGDIVTMIVPSAGHDNGVYLSTQDGAEGSYKPIAVSGTGRLTTHMPVGHIISLAYDADGQVNSIYPIAGAAKGSTTNVSGGCWRVINYYDSGNTTPYGIRVYHQTSGYADTDYPLLVARTRIGTYTALTDGSYSNNTYGLVYGNGSITPTIQPSTGLMKVPGGIESGDIIPAADDTYYLGYDNGTVRRWKIEATSINGTSTYISGAATFEGMTLFNGTVSCYNNLIVGGNHTVTLNSPTTINSSLTTSGVATFNGNVALNSSTTADSLTAGSLLVTGNTSLVNTTTTSDILPSENNTKNIGSSSMKYANIYATTFNGALSGNVTGNVQGNVTGNVTGNLTGNVSGNVTGNVSGNVTGNLTGNVTGNVTGNLYGTADYSTTVRAILSNTEKLYVLGTTTTLSSTGQNVSVKGDSGVYMTTTAGELSAVRHSWNTSGTEKAYSYWNNSTESIDFMFV